MHFKPFFTSALSLAIAQNKRTIVSVYTIFFDNNRREYTDQIFIEKSFKKRN